MSFEDSIKLELRSSIFPACFAGEVLEAVSLKSAVNIALSTAEKMHNYDINKFTSIITKFCNKEFGVNSKEKLTILLNELN